MGHMLRQRWKLDEVCEKKNATNINMKEKTQFNIQKFISFQLRNAFFED